MNNRMHRVHPLLARPSRVEVTSVHIGTTYLGTATKVRLPLEFNRAGH